MIFRKSMGFFIPFSSLFGKSGSPRKGKSQYSILILQLQNSQHAKKVEFSLNTSASVDFYGISPGSGIPAPLEAPLFSGKQNPGSHILVQEMWEFLWIRPIPVLALCWECARGVPAEFLEDGDGNSQNSLDSGVT